LIVDLRAQLTSEIPRIIRARVDREQAVQVGDVGRVAYSGVPACPITPSGPKLT
jgi:hypothetical protein